MPRKKVLCVLTTLLGNRSTSQRLMDRLKALEDIEPTFVLLAVEDYQRYPAPWWARLTNPWESEYIARCKAAPELQNRYDALLVNGWELAVAFQDVARRIPAAVLMDAVPATFHRQLTQRGQRGWKRSLSFLAHHHRFAKAARAFQIFLPMGSDCRDSLEQDYRIRREQCFVTLAPQDTDWWTPDFRRTEPGSRLRLLFVTNDFERKGGDFLLELYSRHLADTCTLTIASNDPVLESRTLPTGVEWLRGRGREQLLEIYRSSDLFVFPTKQDFMPQVIAEALATGTPCIANDVGGTRDLVQDGSNGYLMSPDATHQEWNQRIQRLFQNRAELERMSREARRFAEEKLSLERFQDTLRRVTSGLFASRPNL